jgi:ATP-binding cassette subfamily B protein
MKAGNKRILAAGGKILADIFGYMPFRTVFLIILMAVAALNGFLTLRFIEFITDAASRVTAGEPGDISQMIYVSVFFIAGLLITAVAAQYVTIYKIRFDIRINEYINAKLLKKLSAISYEYYESTEIYEKIHRVNSRLIQGYTAFIESIVRVIEIVLYISAYTVFLSSINILFSVMVIIAVVFSGLIASGVSRKKYQVFSDITNFNQRRDYLNQIAQDKVIHQEYQSFRLFDAILQRYTKAYEDAQKGYLKIHFFTILSESKALLVFMLVITFAYIFIGYQIIAGITAIGILISLMIIFDTLHSKTASLSYFFSNRIEDMLIVNEFYELMKYPEPSAAAQPVPVSKNNIAFKNVSYTYPQANTRALQDLNFEISAGEKIAIVGENGSGKTTFTNILLGLLPGFDGQIRIGDKIYTRENPPPVGAIKCLSQDFTMYQTTIRDNVLMGGRKNPSDPSGQKLDEIIKTIGMADFIQTLPDRLETGTGQLTDGGIELSKGQAQRLAAGRVIVNSDIPLWVFDEPTAYLDPLGEIEMYDFLFNLAQDKTMIFISHRLGFTRKADRILVFHDGSIAESGSHDELLRLNGKYSSMYEAQRSWYG